MRNILTKTIATFFYVGYLPLIPGTFGSLAAMPLIYLTGNNIIYGILLAAIFLISGFLTSGRLEKALGKKDPSCIVIDEACGIAIAFIAIPYSIKIAVIGFIIFRLLDTLKPYPAGILQKLHGSFGIMIDDIVAGIYTNIILQVILRVASSIAS